MEEVLLANAIYYLFFHFIVIPNSFLLFPWQLSYVLAIILILSNLYWEISFDLLYLEISSPRIKQKCCSNKKGFHSAITDIVFPNITNIFLKIIPVFFNFNPIFSVVANGFYLLFYLLLQESDFCAHHKFYWLSHKSLLLLTIGTCFTFLYNVINLLSLKFYFSHNWYTKTIASHFSWILSFYLFISWIKLKPQVFDGYRYTPLKYPFSIADTLCNDFIFLIRFHLTRLMKIIQRVREIDEQFINEIIVFLRTRTIKDYLRQRNLRRESMSRIRSSLLRLTEALILRPSERVHIAEALAIEQPCVDVLVRDESFIFFI